MKLGFQSLIFSLLFVGCGMGPDADLAAFEAGARSAATQATIQAWGETVRTNGAVRFPVCPSWATQLPGLTAVSVGIDSATGDQIVSLAAGGGFGMWGMAIGPTNYQCSLARVRHHWTNGIWCFRQ